AVDALDHRLALEVLQGHGDELLAVLGLDRVVGDVAFVLQDVGDGLALLRRGGGDGLLARLLTVADAGQEVADRIVDAHACLKSSSVCSNLAAPGRRLKLYQLAFFKPGTSPRVAASRSLVRARPNLR